MDLFVYANGHVISYGYVKLISWLALIAFANESCVECVCQKEMFQCMC
uniref:Uncharacterized protein n=1 Tax=Arundo donax TaxID=35708 RepID=A0A0A9G5I9_ARUDO